jgi:hypothetical protein
VREYFLKSSRSGRLFFGVANYGTAGRERIYPAACTGCGLKQTDRSDTYEKGKQFLITHHPQPLCKQSGICYNV